MPWSISTTRSIQRGRTPALRYASTVRCVVAARRDGGLPIPASSTSERSSTRSTGERGVFSSAGPGIATQDRGDARPAEGASDRRGSLLENAAEALEVAEQRLGAVDVGDEVDVEERHLDPRLREPHAVLVDLLPRPVGDGAALVGQRLVGAVDEAADGGRHRGAVAAGLGRRVLDGLAHLED